MKITYDIGSVYVRGSIHPIAETVELVERQPVRYGVMILVDVDRDGRLVGVEVILL